MAQYYIRLYKPHDLDLIQLLTQYQFDLTKAVYCCLTAFANGEHFLIEIPPKREEPLRSDRKIFARALILSKQKDEKAIRILEEITPGYRNNFLKNLLRIYLMYPVTAEFLKYPENMEAFSRGFECFQAGRKKVNAASAFKRKRNKRNNEKKADKRPEHTKDVSKGNQENITENHQEENQNIVGHVLDASMISPEEPIYQEAPALDMNNESDSRQKSEESVSSTEAEDLTDLFSSLI